jgi:hypothetical protein
MSRLEAFRTLPPPERKCWLQCLCLLWIVRLGLSLVSFATCQHQLNKVISRPNPHCRSLGIPAERAAWCIQSASRWVWRTTCLVQAYALQWVLARHGILVQVRIGVKRATSGKMEAHAWVESEGKVLLGDHDLESFQPLNHPGANTP